MSTLDIPEILRPDDRQARPLLISVPHSGTLFPDDERPLYRVPVDELLADGDLFVDQLYDGAETRGATVIRTPVNRFVVDLNRLEDDLSPRSVRGATRRRGEGYYGDRGLIWAVTTAGEDIYRRPLDPARLERRLHRYYRPYHAALRRELFRLRERFGHAVLLDAHSMPSRARAQHNDPVGRRRADIVPGDLEGRSCDSSLRRLIVDFWRQRHYTVAPNRPYRGGGITRRHADPTHRIQAIQLELRRGLYMDEEALQPHEGFPRLQQHCRELVETLAEYVQPR